MEIIYGKLGSNESKLHILYYDDWIVGITGRYLYIAFMIGPRLKPKVHNYSGKWLLVMESNN